VGSRQGAVWSRVQHYQAALVPSPTASLLDHLDNNTVTGSVRTVALCVGLCLGLGMIGTRIAAVAVGLATFAVVGLVTGSAPVAAGATAAPGWSVDPGAGTVQPGAGTPGGRELLLWSSGAASSTVVGAGGLVLHARADLCDGPPQAEVVVDGAVLGRVDVVNASQWWDYPVGPALADGAHTVQVRFLNDVMRADCDRNLHVGWVSITTAASVPALTSTPSSLLAPQAAAGAGDPFTAGRPYVDPTYPSVRAAAQRRGSDPAGAGALDRISAQTAAFWVGDWYSTAAVSGAVRGYTGRADAAGQTGVVVVYAIPGRDCGSYSAGGLTPQTYPGWVSAVADGLRGTRTAVVLEPDALAEQGACSGQGDRVGLLRAAVRTLTGAGATVYLDAGHSGWVDPATMAGRLQAAGVAQARGFATNVSGTASSADERSYAEQLSAATGGTHYVVDTSRNGAGSTGQWCNPVGRKLGANPALVSDGSHQDADLWVKRVGESDGDCGGGPSAGQWWPEYAIALAR